MADLLGKGRKLGRARTAQRPFAPMRMADLSDDDDRNA